MTKELREIAAEIRRAAARGEALALATLVGVRGSFYRRSGARALFGREGPRVGSLAGGCLEADLVLRAREVLVSGEARLIAYDSRGAADLLWGSGLGCGGVADVLLEPLPRGVVPAWLEQLERCMTARRCAVLATAVAPDPEKGLHLGDRWVLGDGEPIPRALCALVFEAIVPPPALWILGAGEDARALARLAGSVGFQVGIVDHRGAAATAERFPDVRIEVRGPDRGVEGLGLDGRSAAVLLHHNYHRDLAWLAALLPSPVAYLGVLGAASRTQRILADLGCVPPRSLYGPVGLDIGAESPEEIAVAVVAEVMAVLAERTGGHLRDRRGPLHAAPREPEHEQEGVGA